MLTDQACALGVAHANAVANAAAISGAGGACAVAPLHWGEPLAAEIVAAGPFDVVLCSDCVCVMLLACY